MSAPSRAAELHEAVRLAAWARLWDFLLSEPPADARPQPPPRPAGTETPAGPHERGA